MERTGAPAALPRRAGLTGAAIRERETVVSNDVARDPRYLTALASTGSEMIVPVIVGESGWNTRRRRRAHGRVQRGR